ncbi:MAG TPA: DNA polymerase IV [Acidimicrobiia bacterium]
MWTEPILHVDMDAFFVEVERLGDASLRSKPVAVGGGGKRGVIASASYEARKAGVHSAQPTAIALRMCPNLLVVAPDHSRYGAVSSQVFEIFRSFTPYVEGLSLDEAFLDVLGLRFHFESPVHVGQEIRSRIKSELGLPASVGVASTKFMAKLASEAAKPDGLLHIPSSDQIEFLHGLPVSSLWGVGPATLAGLQRLGVVTVGDLAELPEATVVSALGPANGRHLLALARGIDERQVEPDIEAKSISVEETYETDLEGKDVVQAALLAHAQSLSGRLRRSGLAARTVHLKVRYQDFTTITRSLTSEAAVDSPHDLYRIGLGLLDQVDLDRPVRLLGLGGSTLEDGSQPRQLTLDASEDWDRLAEAVSGVRERYGDRAVEPARLLEQRPLQRGIDP